MAYYRNNKKKQQKKRGYRKRGMPFSKKQTTAIRSLALKTVNKTRELKCRNVIVNEDSFLIGGSKVIETNLTNSYLFNYVAEGDGHNQRVGTQINPQSIHLKGWCKINGNSYSSSYSTVRTRVIMGYVNNDNLQTLEAGLSSSPLFWNGEAVVQSGDYKDCVRNLNYAFIRPIVDRSFTIAPAPTQDAAGTQSTTYAQRVKDHFMLNIDKKFSTKGELRWDNRNDDCWQRDNLVMIVYTRLLNDDVLVSTNTVEFSLEGNMYYYDA